MISIFHKRTQLSVLKTGKKYTLYEIPCSTNLLMVDGDGITKGDGAEEIEIPGIGIWRTLMSSVTFHYLESKGVRTHLPKTAQDLSIFEGINGNAVVISECTPILMEVVVRLQIVEGSSCIKRNQTLVPGQRLQELIVEFYYKSDKEKDPFLVVVDIENGPRFELHDAKKKLGTGFIRVLSLKEIPCSREEMDYIREQALKISELLNNPILKKYGELVDFKLEFGRDICGKIVLIDAFTLDECRFVCYFATGEPMQDISKEVFRKAKKVTPELKKEILGNYKWFAEAVQEAFATA
ncbi:MAG: phosphoribosylaminoimidazolesuccinocarboxamide synthase [bacterium]|nr:phosphoribosylaminoimidazolesuccinocarboxamide synthase [bacterium]